ncbi:OmpA family protein [Janthinobacterium sp. Marseille]|nr:OmpA family protein [Janthinobacterium sp. Marseille]ABR91226.1 OmpA family protein [Janthinobacterium sp. Marseille]
MINKVVLGLLLGASSSYVAAQTDIQVPPNNAYAQDSRGVVTRSAFGLCWRSGTWTPGDAVAGCDGALVSPIPNPTAPEVASHLDGKVAPAAIAANSCDFTIALESDQTFGLNQAVLNRAAKSRIDRDVLPKLTACNGASGMTITGYTDLLGNARSNQALSEKRAAAVADYLKKKGVTVNMKVTGVGASQPVKDCDSKLNRTKLVACLAPNRRVLIEMHNLPK